MFPTPTLQILFHQSDRKHAYSFKTQTFVSEIIGTKQAGRYCLKAHTNIVSIC